LDDWASNFGEIVSKAELKPAGNGYRTKKRFAKFNNVPELMQIPPVSGQANQAYPASVCLRIP